MGKKRKGFLFRFPLIAAEDSNGVITIKPDSKGSNYKHWDATTKTLTFFKKDFQHMKKEDHHYVEFTLDDRTSQKLRFPCNPQDAMWVINSARCPKLSDTFEYGTIEPLAVVAADTLLAINHNRSVAKFGFSINLVRAGDDDTDPANYVPWDPIINNRDGGI